MVNFSLWRPNPFPYDASFLADQYASVLIKHHFYDFPRTKTEMGPVKNKETITDLIIWLRWWKPPTCSLQEQKNIFILLLEYGYSTAPMLLGSQECSVDSEGPFRIHILSHSLLPPIRNKCKPCWPLLYHVTVILWLWLIESWRDNWSRNMFPADGCFQRSQKNMETQGIQGWGKANTKAKL